jgi:biopolymer transport protein ExbB
MFFAQQPVHLDLFEVFRAAPFIYLILFTLSLFSLTIWIYSLSTLKISKMMPLPFIRRVKKKLAEKDYEEALEFCQAQSHCTGSILASALQSRFHGHQVMIEAMQTEGKRFGVSLWQRISLINDVAIIAPMLGLLGTVLGLFHAFYDVNRSPDTLASIFDGLGIAVGTTVAGLIVAICAMVFYATLKYRVIQLLNHIENETIALGKLIETP